ncbi:MAG: DUF1648 domain-containing protein [Candidatus Omnitrophica bacterium]|nr:DUF1648 domain-containing protein [Candidatus Omnitrophota bacterium]
MVKKFFIILFIFVSGLNVYSYFILPDTVAIHFDRYGFPDDYASRWIHVLFLQILYVFFFALFYYMPVWVFKFPARWINLPNKGFWLQARQKPLTQRKLGGLSCEMGIYLYLFLFYINLIAIEANLRMTMELNMVRFFIALFVFLFLVVYWNVKLLFTFKTPKQISS